MKKIFCSIFALLSFWLFSCNQNSEKLNIKEHVKEISKNKVVPSTLTSDNIKKLFLDNSLNKENYDNVLLDLNIYLLENDINNPYSKKISKLISMDNHILNWWFVSFWYSTNFSKSDFKDKSNIDIKELNNFLLKLELLEISDYLLKSYDLFVNYKLNENEQEFNEKEYEKIDSLFEIYYNNSERLYEKLYKYCEKNLDKILVK